jgi:hypothetical protein
MFNQLDRSGPATGPERSASFLGEFYVAENNNGVGEQQGAPSPFDPKRLRLTQAKIQVRKQLLQVPVRKPSKEWWVRVHPSEEYRVCTLVLELKESREIYLVDPAIADAVAAEPCCGPRLLTCAITRQGVLFLWPLRIPDDSGKLDSWGRSELESSEMAVDRWVRVAANSARGAYDPTLAGSDPPPEWPELTFERILQTSFKNYHINDLVHPVLRQLWGGV